MFAAYHRRNRPFVFRDLYICMHVFLRDDSDKRSLEQSYIGLHRVVKRISDRVFAIKVDGRRFNILVECLKPVYFTAQQEKQAVNKPCTIIDGSTLIEKASFHPKDLFWRITIEKYTDCDFPKTISSRR